jgi:glycosyltransferase involved in cell wall biosynthesis
LALALKRERNDVQVLSSGKEQYSNLADELSEANIKLYHCNSIDSIGISDILESTSTLRQLIKKEGDFDIIHGGGIIHIIKVSFATRLTRDKPKMVATITSFPRTRSRIGSVLGMRMSAIAYSAPDATIALCSHSKSQLMRWGFSPRRIHIIPLFAPDLEWFDQAKKDVIPLERYKLKDNSTPVIFYAARHILIKGFEYYLLAASRVLKKFEATFIVGGQGPFTNRLKHIAKQLGIQENVIFTGLISHHHMPAILHNSPDICVSTSLVEQLPTYIMECMAAGKPIVASSVGGVAEIVRNGLNGYIVRPCDYKETARRIMDLLNDPERIKEMGLVSRKIVESQLNQKISTMKLLKAYDELVHR